MATKKMEKQEGGEAVCLLDCVFGKVGEIVSLNVDEIDIGVNCGMLDKHPDAVSYAKAQK